ncbi:MAG: hypothetical protein WB646_12940 [Steroidobacteraceae bacterium]
MVEAPVAQDSPLGIIARQRRHMRRSALLLGLVALSFYAAYIAFALTHGHA